MMSKATKFPAEQVSELRQRAQAASEVRARGPQGWSKSEADPMELLSAFPSLHLKEGLVLRAYQFREGGNGNGIVWAMPAKAPFPEPDACPRLRDGFLEPPRPPAALEDVLEAVEGDGSAWSYLSASLFSREAAEFGAMWHGCHWSTHTIIDGVPREDSLSGDDKRTAKDAREGPDDWAWQESRPADWQPQVNEDGDTHSALGREAIYRHVDTYKLGSYSLTSERTVVAEGPGGYVF
jgi:hypothetical protein